MSNLGPFPGVIKYITSGDTIVLSHPKNPNIEKTVTIAGIRCPKFSTKEGVEEPYAFDAREYVRKLCVSKTVTLSIITTLSKSGKDYCSVTLDWLQPEAADRDLALILVKQGLAALSYKIESTEDPSLLSPLEQAELEAQRAQLGIWSPVEEREKHVKNVQWKGFDIKKLQKSLINKTIDVIVEQVPRGDLVRVLIPTGEIIPVYFSGITIPSVSNKNADKNSDISKEAKLFTESQLLQKDLLTLTVEGFDEKFEQFYGTIQLSKDQCFTEIFLAKGLGQISEWNIGGCRFMKQLRQAQQQAMDAKIGLWKDYVPPKSSLSSQDKKPLQAYAFEILSGDSLRVRLEDGSEERVTLSSVMGPRDSKHPLFWEAKELIRKLVGGRALTLKVDYRKTSQKTSIETRFVTMTVAGGKNVAVELVSAGLGHVVKHHIGEERSSVYDQLQKAQVLAIQQKKGLHNPKLAKADRILVRTDLTLMKGDPKANERHFQFLKDKMFPKAIVEKVFNGSRFKITINGNSSNKESSVASAGSGGNMMTFLLSLSGVTAPSMKDKLPYAVESWKFSQEQLALKEVDVKVDYMDKNGNFLGQIFELPDGRDYAVKLLENGFALTTGRRVSDRYQEAEEVARKAKKNLGSIEKKPQQQDDNGREGALDDDADNDAAGEEDGTTTVGPSTGKSNGGGASSATGHHQHRQQQRVGGKRRGDLEKGTKVMNVRVTEVKDADFVYLQTPDAAAHLKEIDTLISASLSAIHNNNNNDNNNNNTSTSGNSTANGSGSEMVQQGKFQPKPGDLCLCKFSEDKQWYRAKLLKQEKLDYYVRYIDFGNEEKVKFDSLKPILSEALLKKTPLSKEAYLAFINPHEDLMRQEAIAFVQEFTLGKDCVARHEYTWNNRVYMSIYDSQGANSLNALMVRQGLVFVTKARQVAENLDFSTQMQELSIKQEEAKKERLNLWQNGDVFEDE